MKWRLRAAVVLAGRAALAGPRLSGSVGPAPYLTGHHMSSSTGAHPHRPRREPGAYRPEYELRPGIRAMAVSIGRAALTGTGLVTAYYLLPLDDRSTSGTVVLLSGGLLTLGLVFSWETWVVLRSPYPRLKAVEALTATLLSYLVLFASVYHLLADTTPHAFSEPLTRTDSLYYTLSTFSTVGFGDITADSQTARVVTMTQMACGLLLVGVAVRVLAGAVQESLSRRHPPPANEP